MDSEYINYYKFVDYMKSTFIIYNTFTKETSITHLWYYFDIQNNFICIEVVIGYYRIINKYYINTIVYDTNTKIYNGLSLEDLIKFVKVNKKLILLSQKNYKDCCHNIQLLKPILQNYSIYSYYNYTHYWVIKSINTTISINCFQEVFKISDGTYLDYNSLIIYLREIISNLSITFENNISDKFNEMSIEEPEQLQVVDFNDFISDKFNEMSIDDQIQKQVCLGDKINEKSNQKIQIDRESHQYKTLFIPLSKEDRLYYQFCKRFDEYS